MGTLQESGKVLMKWRDERRCAEPDDIGIEKCFRQMLRGITIAGTYSIDEGSFAFSVVGAGIGENIRARGGTGQRDIIACVQRCLSDNGTDELCSFVVTGSSVETEGNRQIGENLRGIDCADDSRSAKIFCMGNTSVCKLLL